MSLNAIEGQSGSLLHQLIYGSVPSFDGLQVLFRVWADMAASVMAAQTGGEVEELVDEESMSKIVNLVKKVNETFPSTVINHVWGNLDKTQKQVVKIIGSS